VVVLVMPRLPPVATGHVGTNSPPQLSERLLERRRGFDVLDMHGLDGADAVDEREKVQLPGLVSGLRPAQGELGLRDVSRDEEIALLERRPGTNECLPHLPADPVVDSRAVVSGCPTSLLRL